MTTITRFLSVLGIVLLYLWPRYFFVTLAGKGVSGFTFITMALFVLAIGSLLASEPTRRTFMRAAARSWVVLALYGLLWLWRLVCDMLGTSPAASYGVTALDFLYLGSWLVIAAVLFGDRRMQAMLPYLILACGLIATVFGIIEYATGSPISDLLGFYEFAAGDQYTLANIADVTTRGSVIRVKSVFTHPIIYGQIMGAMSPVALHFLLQHRGVRRILGGVFAASIALSILLCNARSPILVAMASGLVYFGLFYLDVRRGSRIFVAMWAVIAALVVAPVATGAFLQIAQGRTSEEAMSSSARHQQVEKGVSALEARPINGFGDGNAGPIAGLIGRKGILTIDNYFLSTAIDTGYLGAALLIGLLVVMVLKGIVMTLREPSTNERSLNGIYTGIIAGLGVGLSVVSILDTLAYIYLAGGILIARSGLVGEVARSAFGTRPQRSGPDGARPPFVSAPAGRGGRRPA